jgi:antirestriction protein ArdC
MSIHTAQPHGTRGSRRDVYQQVTDRILEQLEQGVVPWHRPWKTDVGRPRNFHSGKPYRGINVFLLGFENRPSPWWMTYRQAAERGGQVRKGEKGTPLVKWGKFVPKDEQGDSGRTEASRKYRQRLYLKHFTVFHASQIDGIRFPEPEAGPRLSEEQRIERAEAVANGMPDPPQIRESSRACYDPLEDEVEIPGFGSFESPEAYYLTLFHELTHATGHSSRLARRSLTRFKSFGDHEYSKEELVAEMGAALLAAEAEIGDDSDQASAAYLAEWLKVLKVTKHRKWVVEAANLASKATDFILTRKPGPAIASAVNDEPSGSGSSAYRE